MTLVKSVRIMNKKSLFHLQGKKSKKIYREETNTVKTDIRKIKYN